MPYGNLTPAGYGGFRIDTRTLDVPARTIVEGARYRTLDRREGYFRGTQHEWKFVDFDGRPITQQPGWPTSMPLMSSEPLPGFVPLRMRRPSAPLRLGRIVVKAFSALVFGGDEEPRFPGPETPLDEEAQAFDLAVIEAGELASKFLEARDLGGSVGSVAISWTIKDGEPRFIVHNTKHIYVSEWADRDALIPSYATEMYRYPQEVWDPVKRQFVIKWYYWRRDWTPDADIVYLPCLDEPGKEPLFVIDESRSSNHDTGECHLVWIQNTPCSEIDGEPDYEGLYDQLDSMDVLSSVTVRGTTANLDPTVVLQVDPGLVAHGGVKKGSDNALAVGEGGDAHYMEIGGAGTEAGIKLLDMLRRYALETAQCVVPDPNEVASQGISSVSIKALYRTMLAHAGVIQNQYGKGIKRLLRQVRRAARIVGVGQPRLLAPQAPQEVPGGVLEAAPDPFPQTVIPTLALPPRIVDEEVLDPTTGIATGEKTQKAVDQKPGASDYVKLKWPPFFPNTMKDVLDAATALTTATGGKAILSKQTAVEQMARVVGKDPGEEWAKVDAQHKADMAHEKDMAGLGMPGDGAGNPEGDEEEGDEEEGDGKPFGGKPGGFGKGKPGADEEEAV